MTSPALPQPKQWNRPLPGVMVKDGVFSPCQGQSATSWRPLRLTSIPRSAITAERSLAPLIRSIPSFVTCISVLLLPECGKSQVLQAGDLGLEETQVHHGRAA